MFPQYTPRQMGGELAIWLLITVGALVIPLIVVAICCIRHHCWKNLPSRRLSSSPNTATDSDALKVNPNPLKDHLLRSHVRQGKKISENLPQRPCTKLMESHRLHMMTDMKQMEGLRSYNGPFMELVDDNGDISSQNKKTRTFSRPNSLKKQHVHWLDKPVTSQTNTFFTDNILSTSILTESPSNRRHRSVLATLSSIPSHSMSTPIIPAGSVVHHTGTSQLLTSVQSSTPTPIDHNLFV